MTGGPSQDVEADEQSERHANEDEHRPTLEFDTPDPHVHEPAPRGTRGAHQEGHRIGLLPVGLRQLSVRAGSFP